MSRPSGIPAGPVMYSWLGWKSTECQLIDFNHKELSYFYRVASARKEPESLPSSLNLPSVPFFLFASQVIRGLPHSLPLSAALPPHGPSANQTPVITLMVFHVLLRGQHALYVSFVAPYVVLVVDISRPIGRLREIDEGEGRVCGGLVVA